MTAQERRGRKRYQKPVLITYGGLVAVTRAQGNLPSKNDMAKGNTKTGL